VTLLADGSHALGTWTSLVSGIDTYYDDFTDVSVQRQYLWLTACFNVVKLNVSDMTYELFKSFPNPFNPSTTIEFSLMVTGDVSLDIYNITGQMVRSLVSGSLGPGRHMAVWNGLDESGSTVSSGVYFYRLKMGEQVIAKRMVMAK